MGDYVFYDNNINGIQDDLDTAAEGVTVNLIQDGAVVSITTTDANGYYLFDELTPGDYQVEFVAPESYYFTTANVGDDALDSDADVVTGLTQVVTLESGEFNGTLDAGLATDLEIPGAPGTGTPGFWHSKFGKQFWDGIVGNEQKAG